MAEGHAVRGTTRAAAGANGVQAAGAEAWLGDPDRVGTLTGALDNVTVVCWLFGSARGSWESLRALHGPRLRAFCERVVDTTVRGLVYEAAGEVDGEVLASGSRIVTQAAETWEIPVRILETHPADHERWMADAHAAVDQLLAVPQHASPRIASATLER